MNNRDNIQDELNELNSRLPAPEGDQPLSVPEGYFENLAGSILNRIKQEEAGTASEEIQVLSPLLAGISRVMPQSLPEGYFHSNLVELPAIMATEESDMLASIGKNMPFQVPAGYFDQLPGTILSRTAPASARVIPLYKRSWMKMAAAAMIIGIITISGIFYYNGHQNATAKDPVAQLKKASTRDLEEFIKTTDVTSTATANNTPARAGDVKKMLKDVSTKELNAFLDQVPTEDEELAIN